MSRARTLGWSCKVLPRKLLLLMRQFYVYILSSRSAVLYVGVTSDLERRVYEHKHGVIEGFTKQYGIKRLIYFEVFDDPVTAIDREKQIKRWRRSKKLALVRTVNPSFKELSLDETA